MGTHIKFRLKTFSGNKAKEVEKFIKTPAGIFSIGALTISSANLATNVSRHKKDRAYQKKQIEAMDKLTQDLEKLEKEKENPKPKYINFRQKR